LDKDSIGKPMNANINQNRTFQQRLTDFAPELGAFLNQVWNARATIDLTDYAVGSDQIYGMYSGTTPDRPYNPKKLAVFVDQLKGIAGTYNIKCQELDKTLNHMSDGEISFYGLDLWIEFYHVFSLSKQYPARYRLYVHASNWPAGIEIMKVIIGQFTSLTSLVEAKIVGPGSLRLDTIVAYLSDEGERAKLIEVLLKTAQARPDLFADALPPLVKRAALGIGTTDEPPKVEIKAGRLRHSFGSFYSNLIWVALKSTPQVKSPTADGRHMLDNVLYSLRLLNVDQRNPTRFPDALALGEWSERMMQGH
jgi:hypothetical protein